MQKSAKPLNVIITIQIESQETLNGWVIEIEVESQESSFRPLLSGTPQCNIST